MPNIKTKLLVVGFFLFLTFYGALIAGLVLREPDICFLLASGRWIVEHASLPVTDPFSYTTGYHAQPYVIEKWLTEVIFYTLWKFTSTTGLLVFDAMVLGLTFVVMPYRLCRLHNLKGGKALAVSSTCMLASFSHLAVRPEIFSYLLIAVFLELLTRFSRRDHSARTVDWAYVAAFAGLTVLWSNLHTLFIVGGMMLALYIGCQAAAFFVFKTERHFNLTIVAAFIASLLATLVNPYGLTLWAYLPNVFGPFNDRNNEMQPIGMGAFTNPFNYGFDALVVAGSIALTLHGLRRSYKTTDLFFRALVPAGIVGGIKTIRTIPISDLFISCGLAHLLGQAEREATVTGGGADASAAADADASDKPPESTSPLDEIFDPLSAVWITSVLFLCGLGAYLMTFIVEPDIPQGSAAFAPPLEAIAFLEKHRPKGNLLNYAHFGNVMMWKMHDTPPVFIDSRYNLFGNDLLRDYLAMMNCTGNWQELMQKYKIDWIFMPPGEPLAKTLENDKGWQLIHKDRDSVIIVRREAEEAESGTESGK